MGGGQQTASTFIELHETEGAVLTEHDEHISAGDGGAHGGDVKHAGEEGVTGEGNEGA